MQRDADATSDVGDYDSRTPSYRRKRARGDRGGLQRCGSKTGAPHKVPSNYRLTVVAKGKKAGTHAAKAVGITSATYNSSGQAVTLVLAGKPPTGPLQLMITGSAVVDAEGRGIDGSNDGRSGGNYQTTLG